MFHKSLLIQMVTRSKELPFLSRPNGDFSSDGGKSHPNGSALERTYCTMERTKEACPVA